MKNLPCTSQMILLVTCTILGAALLLYTLWPRPTWTQAEIGTLRSLWIGTLPTLSADPSNRYSDSPEAAALGERIFFDTRFSSNGAVSCATCHIPQQHFQDGKADAYRKSINACSHSHSQQHGPAVDVKRNFFRSGLQSFRYHPDPEKHKKQEGNPVVIFFDVTTYS